MYSTRQDTNNSSQKPKVKEGTLVRVHSSQDIRVRAQNPELGHLDDVEFYGSPIVGVVTKLWPGSHGGREFEMLSEGEFLILTTSNGFDVEEIEVLS